MFFNHFFYCKQIRNTLGDLIVLMTSMEMDEEPKYVGEVHLLMTLTSIPATAQKGHVPRL